MNENKMKTISKISTTFISAFLISVAGCAATGQRQSTGQYVDDTVITTGVKTAIIKEPSLKINEIKVETFKGVVQLSGFVRSDENMATAVSLARDVKGVESVRNDMRLK